MVKMKKFEATSPSVQVNGETILAFVNVASTKDSKLEILKKNGIVDPKPGNWYSQQAWLNAFKEISESLGPFTMRLIGKEILKSAIFPPIKNFSEAFNLLDKAYKMNHRRGEIGYYKLISYEKSTLIMECNTPYPEVFDEGILLGLFSKFKEKSWPSPRVKIEHNANGVLYTLNW